MSLGGENGFRKEYVKALCEKRALCRTEKRFGEADAILQQLHDMGIEICDSRGTWKHKATGTEGTITVHQNTTTKAVKVPPPQSRRESDWDCPKCENVNWGSRTKCFICGVARQIDASTILPKRLQILTEKKAAKDEQRACDEHYRRAQERIQADAKQQAVKQDLALAEQHRMQEAHPVPLVDNFPSQKGTRSPNRRHKDEGPPQPKAGDASGLAALKRVRQEMIDRDKRPKVEEEAEDGNTKKETPGGKKLSLESMNLSTEVDTAILVRNLKVLTKVAGSNPSKRNSLRGSAKVATFLKEIPAYASLHKSSNSKEVVVLMEATVKLIASLVACEDCKKDQSALTQWMLDGGTQHLEALASIFLMHADSIKVSLLLLCWISFTPPPPP
eukprot:TRINITY_DN8104_c0_g1_i2.p1 TRINITY_DN8104_c0_g1~~TRINITY_DN8104_c0_g1_i2.p1  ORF type:complete len:388 (+),score=76.76 TRINITY_DN8104_c0_g1_i2:38-1201(+)